ncbi:MAG TPA: hypothetical protein VFD36_30155 [Kofleriaceae bacterium]|nr:hypothetical protein [Kofleriaceae bacterium]
MGRIGVVGLVIGAAVLGRSDVGEAGGAHAGPAVRVVAPGGANGRRFAWCGITMSMSAMELDDLPPPQL